MQFFQLSVLLAFATAATAYKCTRATGHGPAPYGLCKAEPGNPLEVGNYPCRYGWECYQDDIECYPQIDQVHGSDALCS
ncbi:unnamed protein product [Zymoseptoria tritici ST99CH_3D7]|uniref:CBM1 domain-containing protein n=2 Tax=Zymoseptoria tritici TaxID=1047171 RepID=A0A1X7RYD0_ZYMT9|nr:unnamed protein product [Zymoseptoria tritici ST99CH_3D7]SMR54492.1 unnamed protein product [Zymoseptoria tritici ST99CH_1E4]